MLTKFTLFETIHTNGVPFCEALFCVGTQKSKPLPYAWVETVTNPSRLTIIPIEHDTTIKEKQVFDALAKMTGEEGISWDNFETTLTRFVLSEAYKKRSARDKWYANQGRKYKTTQYAAMDAAIASRPTYPHINLPNLLKTLRLGLSQEDVNNMVISMLQGVLTSHGFEKTGQETSKFRWDNYHEGDNWNMLNIIKATVVECMPSRVNPSHARIKENFKLTRTKTAKSRLEYLVDLSDNLSPYYPVQQDPDRLLWLRDNPPPLKALEAKDIAAGVHGEPHTLLADHMTWLVEWHRVNLIAQAKWSTLDEEDRVRYTYNPTTESFDSEALQES